MTGTGHSEGRYEMDGADIRMPVQKEKVLQIIAYTWLPADPLM